jgi:autotransporter-associated beta strand protein
LNKTSAGSLILSGTNTHTGTVGVNQGTLVLNGSTASSVMTVSAGAVLTGSGSTAGRVVLSGSVKPGNSPGTLLVAGDFSMNAGSSFDAELDGRTYSAAGGAGSHDRIALTGANSVFTAGGQIAPVLRGISAPADNTFSPVVGDAFRVVTTANANGVDGTGFFSVTDPTAGMPTNTRFDVIYGANHVDLVLTPDNLEVFAQPYGIRNMVNAARAFDGIRPEQGTRSNSDTHKLFNGLYGLAAEPLAKTILQASGEIHAFALSETRQGWQTAANSVGTAAAVKTERNLWVDASGQNTDYKQDSRASAYETDNTQLWLGTHVLAFKGAQLGVAAGASKRMVHAMNASSASVDTESLAIYAVGNKERFDYAAVYSFNQSSIKTSRQIGLSTGNVSNSSDSNVNGSLLSLSAGMTYALNAQVNGRVWVNGTFDQTQAKALTEQGSSVTALGVAKESINSSQATLGYTFSGQVKVPDSRPGTWTLGVGATKLLDQGSHPVTRQMSLHSAKWEVSTPKMGDSSQFLQAGVRLPMGANADAWVNLGGTKRQGASGQFGNVGLSIKW